MNSFGFQQSYESLIHQINAKKCILCAGSGLSRQYVSDFPLWSDFIKNILRYTYSTKRIDRNSYFCFKKLLQEHKLFEVVETCRRRLDPKEFEKIFIKQFQKPLNHPPNNEHIHNTILNMPFFGVITTNFDQVFEIFCQRNGFDIPVFTQNESPSLGILLQIQQNDSINSIPSNKPKFIFKVHGDLIVPGACVITQNDYRNLIQRNISYKSLMRTLLSQYSFLFIGFSFSDPDFQLILNEVFDAYEGEIPDHYLLTNEMSTAQHEFFYRTYRIRTIPYGDHDKLPTFIEQIDHDLIHPLPILLDMNSSIEQLNMFMTKNSNFEDPNHRNNVLSNSISILKIFYDALHDPNLEIEQIKILLEIERILTHHLYLFSDLEKRQKLAPELLKKIIEIHKKDRTLFYSRFESHRWKLFMLAIEDIGFPLVRNVERITGTINKDKKEIMRRIDGLETNIRLMKQEFNLLPCENSSDIEELRAACYLARIKGLQLINLEENYKDGIPLLEKALKIAQKAGWESLESALVQDIIRPEPNPWADFINIAKIKTNHHVWRNSQSRLKESIELARYRGMHRRVIGGLIGLSLLTEGEEKIKYLRHARDYYSIHLVKQPPVFSFINAEEVITINEIGHLTKFEREKRYSWFTDFDDNNKRRVDTLNPLYKTKMEQILKIKFK